MTATVDDPDSPAPDWPRAYQRLLAYERALLAARPAHRLTDAVLDKWTDLRRQEISCRLARDAPA